MFYSWQKENLILQVYIQPKASREEIGGEHNKALKIKITAAPVDGKANKQITKLLAKRFAVPIKRVELIKGEKSRLKTFRINQPKQLISGVEYENSISNE